MADPRVHELQALLPRCLLPDWVRLGYLKGLFTKRTDLKLIGILFNSSVSDILIFLRGELDSRETRDVIEGRCSGDADIIPLFGRLSAGEKQRIFAPAPRRKFVIATNIAETSPPAPGVCNVIDSGLARTPSPTTSRSARTPSPSATPARPAKIGMA